MSERTSEIRALVVDAIDEPIVVVDGGEVVDANAAFREWFDADRPVGEPLSDVLDGQPTLREHVESGTEAVVDTETAGGRRSVSVSSATVSSEDGDRVGRLALLHDVTEQKRQRRELERRNERLDEFAGLISHDLRNPLDVALGRTNALKERVDDPELLEHLEELSDAHDRMQRIITDVLTLARQGHDIEDPEPVDLGDLAEDAWSNVATAGATLRVETDRSVSADPGRLQQLLENLARNAVEHGGEDVTVTVGDAADGFYVADDGPGVPPEDRDRVFEAGYTGENAGTGLGLAIVKDVADAHGWEVAVGESDAGGARFEITGTGDECAD